MLLAATCGELFSAAAQRKLQCLQPLPGAGEPPETTSSSRRQPPKSLPLHTADPSWTFSDHLRRLRAQRHSYRDVFWHVWGLVQVLYCSACHSHYPARHHCHCSYHPQEVLYTSETAAGVYPCCGVSIVIGQRWCLF